MQKYSDYAPTGFDPKGLNADRHGIGQYLVVLSRNRDSSILEESNWDAALKLLGGESDDNGPVQIHRFGHWACGWFELLLVNPDDDAKRAIAEDIENSLSDYPILDDDDYSDREYTYACDTWESFTIADRVDYLQRAQLCIFAARRAELPDDPQGALFERLTA